MSWYLAVLKKYADFSGRARRKEYWMFYLVNFLIIFVLEMIFIGGALNNSSSTTLTDNPGFVIMSILLSLYGLAIFIPSLAVQVRRLHDVGKSGWWIFISLVPIIGPLWLLILMLTDSDPGTNQYGPSPKAVPGIAGAV